MTSPHHAVTTKPAYLGANMHLFVRHTRGFRAPTILFPNPQLLHFGVFATKSHTVSNHAHSRDESIVHFVHCGGGRRCFQRRIVFTVINGRRNYHPVLNEHCSFVTGEEFKLGIPCRPLRASCSALVASGGFYGGIWGTRIMVGDNFTGTHGMRQTFITAQCH